MMIIPHQRPPGKGYARRSLPCAPVAAGRQAMDGSLQDGQLVPFPPVFLQFSCG